jgi:hypothetical protein
MITGHKDTDLKVLLELGDREFLIFCGKKESLQSKNKYINKLCNSENLWKNRLFKYYAEIYPELGQTWKNLYLSLVYHLNRYKYKKNMDSFIDAIGNGYLDVIKYLTSFPELISPSGHDNHAIKTSSSNGRLDIVKYLMTLPNVDPAAADNYAVTSASYYGNLDVVKYLMGLPKEYGIDPAANNNIAIRWASECGYLDVVKYLMSLPKEYGINPTADNNYAIKKAIKNKHLEVVKYLLSLSEEYEIKVTKELIRYARMNGDLEMQKYLEKLL